MLHAHSGQLMGTHLDIVLLDVGEDEGSELCARCISMTEELEQSVSRFVPGSDVSRINRSEPLSIVAVSPDCRSLLETAAAMCRRTLGTFDVTLGEGSRFDFAPDGELLIPANGLKIDMGGLAKGVAVERMRAILNDADVKNAFISFGGSSILGLGRHPEGDSWRVSIPDPFSGHTLRTVDLRDTSLSTSGNSREYRGHILDPLTGHAVTGRRLSAIVAPSAVDAEVLSTAWLVTSPEQRIEIMKNFDILEEFVYN